MTNAFTNGQQVKLNGFGCCEFFRGGTYTIHLASDPRSQIVKDNTANAHYYPNSDLTLVKAEYVYGAKYRLLPNASYKQNSGASNYPVSGEFRDGGTVIARELHSGDGDFYVALDDTTGYRTYVSPEFLIKIEETAPAPVVAPFEIEVGKEYKLLPIALEQGVYYDSATTRVKVLSKDGASSILSVETRAMNGPSLTHTQYVRPSHLAPLDLIEGTDEAVKAEEAPKLDPLNQRIVDLEARVAQLLEGNRTNQAQWKKDNEWLAASLIEKADEQNLCSEFEDFVDEANSRMNFIQLEGRERDFTVERTYTYSVTVSARDADCAEEMADYLFDDVSANDMYHVSTEVEED